jgi:hypothetical protein
LAELSLDLLESLLVDIINRCRTIQNRSALLIHSEFASEKPEKLAKLISAICGKLMDHLVILRNKYIDDPVNILTDVRIIDDFVRELGANLRYVDGAIATKLPWSLPQPLELLSEKILPGTSLMLRPQWKYNYAILPYDLGESYREELEKLFTKEQVGHIFEGFPERFHIISFPSIERRTALLHCDLGHEIGHLVAKKFLEVEDENSAYLVDLRKGIAARVTSENSGAEPQVIQEIIQQKLELAAEVWWSGLTEIISDMFAMRLLGPAALFALFQMALGDTLDLPPTERTSFYPPWRTRLRHALHTLETVTLIPISVGDDESPETKKTREDVQQRIDEIKVLTSEDSDREAIADDWVTLLAYESIEGAIEEVERFLQNEHGGAFMVPAELYGDVYHLVQRLSYNIPPNAIEDSSFDSRPARLEIILNAAWFYRISALKNPFTGGEIDEDFQKQYRILNRLTLKAIEFSHVQQRHNEWNATAGLEQ